MWAPFFDLPWEGRQAATTPTSGPRAAPSETPAGLTALEEGKGTAAGSSRPPSAAPNPNAAGKAPTAQPKPSAAASAPRLPQAGLLRPGAVGVGPRAECVEVQDVRLRCQPGASGRALADVAVVQDRAYWEVLVKVVDAALCSRLMVGVSAHCLAQDALLKDLGAGDRSYGVQFGAGGAAALREGDVISVAYDQAVFPVSVNVWHNGTLVQAPAPRGLKGEMWPAILLSGCVVDWALDEEHWKSPATCPGGFSPLMPSRGLIGGD